MKRTVTFNKVQIPLCLNIFQIKMYNKDLVYLDMKA